MSEDDVVFDIKKDGNVLRTVTWGLCKDLGTVDLFRQSSGDLTVEASLMSLLVMNRVAQKKVIPEQTRIENTIHENWQTLEQVAMISLLSQLRARQCGKSVSALVFFSFSHD